MVSKEKINEIFNYILNDSSFEGTLNTKCRPPFDEVGFSKLKTNKQIANFFGLEYYSKGRPDIDGKGANKNIAFYDKRNHCMLVFYTDDGRKIQGLDFKNNYVDDENYNGDYIANLKDVIKAYYDAPQILKKATWIMQFENGNGSFTGGDCAMYGINMYRPSLWGDIHEVMFHEMSHALSFQSIDWRNGEELHTTQLPAKLKDRWDKASQKDYDFQKKNNLPRQDISEYGETNPSEAFAEMGAVVTGKMAKVNFAPNSAYKVYEKDETRPDGRRFSHIMTADEIIEANPNRAKLMKEIIKENVNVNNKRDYINQFYKESSEMYGEELRESW